MAELVDRLRAALGDNYRILRELGGGGMSRVFLAEETRLGRRVVIKVLPPDMAAGVNAERFEREIQLAASLQHPHIVQLLTAGATPDLLYYVMPFIEGESLRARLAREGALPMAEVLRILSDVVDALAYSHHHGVVHRDIKPDNVMLSGKHAHRPTCHRSRPPPIRGLIAGRTSTPWAQWPSRCSVVARLSWRRPRRGCWPRISRNGPRRLPGIGTPSRRR